MQPNEHDLNYAQPRKFRTQLSLVQRPGAVPHGNLEADPLR